MNTSKYLATTAFLACVVVAIFGGATTLGFINESIPTITKPTAANTNNFQKKPENLEIITAKPNWLKTSPDSGNQKKIGDTLPFPIYDDKGWDYYDPTNENYNPFDLNDPKSVKQTVTYDPATGMYIVTETVGGDLVRPPVYLTFDEYWNLRQEQIETQNWQTAGQGGTNTSGTGGAAGFANGLLEKSPVKNLLKLDNNALKGLFCGDNISISPTGTIDLEFAFRSQRIDNPALPIRAQRQPATFEFNENINMGLNANIGDCFKANLNFNTKAVFDLDNQIKLEYIGDEDKIVQEIRAGYVNFPLPTSLIPGAQSLWGIQAKLKFGRLTVNSVISEQKSQKKSLVLENGAQTQKYEVNVDEYDENRHFFLGHYFRDNYENAVKSLPYINSNITITKLEVWVSDSRSTENSIQRDIVGFADLGEPELIVAPGIDKIAKNNLPDNNANTLYQKINSNGQLRKLDAVSSLLTSGQYGLTDLRDFRKTIARKLNEDEFTYDPQLGFVSLNFTLQTNEVLAVAYEYTTSNGGLFRVGEFAQDVFTVDQKSDSRVLFLKMLKSSTQLPTHPIWDLMMKNIYNLGAYQINPTDFKLDIYYQNPGGGDIRYLPEGEGVKGQQLIKLLGFDRLNINREPYPDGIFDFVDATRDFPDVTNLTSNTVRFGTIVTRNGRLMFTVLEPFGQNLRQVFLTNGNAPEMANKYAYDELYDSTKTIAANYPEFSRFVIKGTYKSNISSEISLGAFNIPPNSFRVVAGGVVLKENSDYTVDYNLGRITILNEAYINSGSSIQIQYEDSSFGGFQRKSYMGTRLDYYINKDFSLGATAVRLSERPFSRKVNFDDNPIKNSMVGMDGKYYKDLPSLTRLLDKLPGLSTKEPSALTLNAEGAVFMPGHPKAIGNNDGTVYIDDFEGSNPSSPLNIYTAWSLASTPRFMVNEFGETLFPESVLNNNLDYGKNRARLAWYRLDGYSKIQSLGKKNVYTRIINERELFPNRNSNQLSNLGQQYLYTLDLAYYPEERGPYNFDANSTIYSDGVTASGKLKNPRSRWAGITHNMLNKDFEQANFEFIEFWLMDPFAYDYQQNNSGEFYLQLGSVSEDVLKDGKQFFENSLPTNKIVAKLDTTNWGLISKIRPVTDQPAFDNDVEGRKKQDVGYDGMSDTLERQHFAAYLNELKGVLTPEAYTTAETDPSSDNFRHFNNEYYDQINAGVTQRYKYFSGPDGNSPSETGNDNTITTDSGTTIPETEDLNKDKSLGDAENYFQYRIKLKPADQMQIGNDYLADYLDAKLPDTLDGIKQVRWYHFKIPINAPSERIGETSLRNIEFMRMVMTGFEDSVILRMAEFNLVRNTWRRFNQALREEGEYQPANPDTDSEAFFSLSTVSLEENADRTPIAYVLPPGIEQDLLASSSAQILLDERAIQMQACNLPDGEGRGIFKRLAIDMRRFKKLQMFIHAEQLLNDKCCLSNDINDGDVSAFIRIGDDFQENYYEYEIPLRLTQNEPPIVGNTNANRELVWPKDNRIELVLQDLIDLKLQRNFDPKAQINKPYSKYIPVSWDSLARFIRITVVGSPDFGDAKQIMLGVRNPKINAKTQNKVDNFGNLIDDEQTKCIEVWFNELRLTDFDESPGYAALANANLKLADWGNVTVAANAHTEGFGTLEQKLQDRYKDNFTQYDASGTFEMGKFLPAKSGLRLPLYLGYSESVSTPQYDPYDTDIELNTVLDSIRAKADLPNAADSAKAYKNITQTQQTIKSVNLTNIRKERTNTERKPQFYDVENWNATYAYTDQHLSDPIIESDRIKRHKASLAYSYSARPIYWSPMKRFIPQKSKYLQLIRDFNLNLVPSNLSYRNDINREIGVLKLRAFEPGLILNPSYSKIFTWDRNYGLKYNPARSITADFTATHRAVIDEPQDVSGKDARDTIIQNLKRFGRPKGYNQSLNLSYTVPLDKFPLLSWAQLRATYGATYNWQGNPIEMADTLGNTIGNARNMQLNAEFNLTKIYNSIPYFKRVSEAKINAKKPTKKTKSSKEKAKEPEQAKKEEDKKKTKTKGQISIPEMLFVRPLFSLRRVSATIGQRHETTIPGFMERPKYFGMYWGDGKPEPGWDFIFGNQPDLRDWLEWAASKDIYMLTTNRSLNTQVRQTMANTISLKANLEPYPDLKIDLTATLNHNRNHSEFFKVDTAANNQKAFQHLSKMDVGSYTISYYALNTMFDSVDDSTKVSETFKIFEKNRPIISKRWAELNPNPDIIHYSKLDSQDVNGFFEGYGPYSQDVLIPAFIAAYTKKSAEKVNLNPFNGMPKPNWRVTYSGLGKLPLFNRAFNSINLTHSYTSTLTISNYRNNLIFDDRYYDQNLVIINENGLIDYIVNENIRLAEISDLDTLTGNYFSYYQIPQILINEQMAPLAGIDATWVFGLTTRVEYKKGRTLGMSFQDYQLSEAKTEEFTIGVGYKFPKMTMPFKFGKKKLELNNDLTFNFDFSVRDNLTVNYRLDQGVSEVTAGMKTIRIAPSLDYVINNRLRISLFYERSKNIPALTTSYPITSSKGGIRLNYTLGG
ncbi:MAG: cell surface protein SprA [Bacteroidetes bacterium]|nr:cell surface protein SprA [Bacteroidota bacterium]